MSCFDSVYVKCPNCGREMEFQSKADKCEMQSFTTQAVPVKVAVDLDGNSDTCPKCQSQVALHAVGIPVRVTMVAEIVEEEED